MLVNFCYDDLGPNPDLGYPNLARPALRPDEFDTTWPRSLPLRLLMYLQQWGIRFISHRVSSAPRGSWYPVALAWHDFDCDYFALMSEIARHRARNHEIRFLFYYHEGDNPARIKQRFDHLCACHDLPEHCYLFVSANSAAEHLTDFYYFNDHEYFFSYVNRHQAMPVISSAPRRNRFTALTRTHKWWRASVMSDLWTQELLADSLWSYNTTCLVGDRPEDNPLQLDAIQGWQQSIEQFVSQGPYWCDSEDSDAHNDHRSVNLDLYQHSYCQLILETLYDVDQSGGTFLTEKTYKCLKFGQPFVIIGPWGSLRTLRRSGYRVFDHVIDNSYDEIENNTQRWLAARRAIAAIADQDLETWFESCVPDLVHNQWQFSTKAHGNLDKLVAVLTADRNVV